MLEGEEGGGGSSPRSLGRNVFAAVCRFNEYLIKGRREGWSIRDGRGVECSPAIVLPSCPRYFLYIPVPGILYGCCKGTRNNRGSYGIVPFLPRSGPQYTTGIKIYKQ